ncbi:MAG: TraB/GumN family protein [Defluviitaleaceae bacterium]|nr:TraB/GumN family protein [Defluviitaleaceae bacterium]MCL2274584.1 TraB/GumN family protein [Defluviitaleaceae bacterium]
MKNKLWGLLLLLLLTGCANNPQNNEPDTGIHGALHRVEYGGNVAYIFGTLHGGRPEWFPLANIVEDALRRADIIAVEIDEVGTSQAEMLAAVQQAMFIPNGQTWVDILPHEHYTHLVETIGAWDIDYADVNTMNPAFLLWSISVEFALSFSDLGIALYDTVDYYIAAFAREHGLPVIGLEDATQQIEILYNPPFDVLLSMIQHLHTREETLERFLESGELTIDRLAYYYSTNNFAPIIANMSLMGDDTYLHVTYMRDKVQGWRSTYYAHEITRLLRETPQPTTFFVAVGLAHVISSNAGENFTDIIEQLHLLGLSPVAVYLP